MHTGYDNFWMHKNSRLKPVHNLPNNDNYSCALLTDNYTHMQSRGCPSHLSSFIPPQNNAASSHESNHYRNSSDQSMWPSSVYSLAFTPSYANNLHPQEPFFGQTNNFVYLPPNPQAQEKRDFRHLEMSNSNVNILTMHKTNTSTLANNGLAHAQNNKNTNSQMPRIRVKDVFSLNNESVQSQLELDGHFGTRQQKEMLVDSAHCNRALESQTQTEYIKYKKANLVESSKSSHFECRPAKQTCLNPTQQEQFQNSCSFSQQNDGFSLGDFEFSGSRQIESSLSSESFQSRTPASLLNELLPQERVLERGLQSCQENPAGHSNARPGHASENVTPMRNLAQLQDPNYSDCNYSRSCCLNERAPENGTSLRKVSNVHCDLQENLSEVNEANFKSRNSASNVRAKNAPSVEENRIVNSILPPVGESHFRSHHASPEVASSRDSSANGSDVITQKNSVPAVSTSLMSSPRNCQQDIMDQQPRRQEVDVLSSKDGEFFQHSTGASEIIQQKFAVEISGGDDSSAEQGMPTNDFSATPLTLKQESLHPEIESISLLSPPNTPGGKESHPKIKTEENCENSRARECEIGDQPPEVVNQTLAQFHAEGCSSADKCRSDSAPTADSENHTDKVNTLKSSSSNRGHVQKFKKKIKRGTKVSWSKENYKSNINRDKLDLLIQFLKKDQDSGGSNSCKERQSLGETASISDSDSYRSRRKLNKASIVRNKNNSREMISLMSPKGSNFTCKAPRITEGSENSEKTEGGKSHCSKDKVMVEVDKPKEYVKRNNPSQENESKKDDSWMAEPNNEAEDLSKQSFQESSERQVPKDKCAALDENVVISTVRAFQNSKTQFCVSCKLVSSIESFWINVVSGQVRCLNCLERRTLKTKAKENILNSKSNDLGDSSVKALEKRKGKIEKENKSKESSAVDGSNSWNENERKRSSKSEGALRKLNGMKETVRQELLEMFVWENRKSNERKQTTNSPCRLRQSISEDGVDSQKEKPSEERVLRTEKSACTDISSEKVGRRFSEKGTNQGMKDINATKKTKSSSGEEDFAKRERQPSSFKQAQTNVPKEQYSEGDAKEETVIKSEKSHGRRASRSEERPENRAKAETKKVTSSITRRSSEDTEEEFGCDRVSVIEERGQKDLKVRHFTDESRKPLHREGWPARKDYAAEEAAKRSAKHETLEKSKNQNIWREVLLQKDQKRTSEAQTSKLFPRRDPKPPDALARSSFHQTGAENQRRMESTEQPRKRKNSDEYPSPHKVHILQEFVKKDSLQATHPSKSSEVKVSKENHNFHRYNLWSGKISSEKSSKECVNFGEHFRKEAKSKAVGLTVEHPRRKSKDEQGGPEKVVDRRRTSESSEGPKRKSWDGESAFPKARILMHINGEGKRENMAAENLEKKKSEEKGSRSSEKVASMGFDVLSSPGKDRQSQRTDGASILFREKHTHKTTTGPHTGTEGIGGKREKHEK